LADLFSFPKDVYPVGRLDYESEGLLILTNDNYLKSKLINPQENHKKTYYVQVEGIPTQTDLENLKNDLEINFKGVIHKVRALSAELIEEPQLPNRNPPIRFRRNIPTSWLSITITEGKYHQVRKMTAKIGFPTLRLVRYSIENLNLTSIEINKPIQFSKKQIYRLLNM
jgi:ribosomal large subunit pseudouridine synthase E (EC 5.4.99.-)